LELAKNVRAARGPAKFGAQQSLGGLTAASVGVVWEHLRWHGARLA